MGYNRYQKWYDQIAIAVQARGKIEHREPIPDVHFTALTKHDGGATRNIHTLIAPTEGYAVGGYIEATEVPADRFTATDVGRHLAALHQAMGHDPTIHQGSWRRPKDDVVVLDASKVYKDKGLAITEGMAKKQDAVFNYETMADVNLPKVRPQKIEKRKQK